MSRPSPVPEPPAAPEAGSGRQAAWLALLLFGLLALVVWGRLEPPPARPLDAPAADFSAVRAAEVLERVLGDQRPHPTGSSAQSLVRARLLAELEQLGVTPQLQSGVACGPEGVCAELHNILALLPGSDLPAQTLLAAHYDSVPAGPGAGDDGQGVATLLEVARALRTAPLRSGVWLLFTDGEELGLLGARLFAAEHPLLRELRAVLNLEARGNRGTSLMFQTGPRSGWLVRSFAHAPRPIGSSLFEPVYRMLPNDTDFTVFTQHGLEGLNFAFLGGVSHYHTLRDSIDQLDLRSVQQQGDGVLGTLRQLDAERGRAGEASPVFFDVLGLGVLTLPMSWMLPAALLGLACWAVVLARERRERRGRSLGRAALALLLAWGLPLLATALTGTLLELLGGLPFAVIATPQPFLLGILVWVFGGQALAHWLTPGPEQRRAFWDVTWLCWSLLALALALAVPAASYLPVLPALAAALLRLITQLRPRWVSGAAGSIAVALFAGLLVLPLLTLLPSTLELSLPVALAGAYTWGLSPLGPLVGPLLASPRLRFGLCGGGFALSLSLLLLPAYSSQIPQRLSLVLEAKAGGEAHWLAEGNTGKLPAALRAAAEFAPLPSRPHPWPGFARGLMYVAPAPTAAERPPAPRITRQARSVRLELAAPPDLWALGIRSTGLARITAVRWQGRTLQPLSSAARERLLFVLGEQRQLSVELEFDREPSEPPEVVAIALGLPEPGARLQAARGGSAVASGFGDMTVLHLLPRVELAPR